MIYLDNTIILPNLYGIDSSSYSVVLENNVTNEKVSLDVSNLSTNELYYEFNLDASSLAQNEYTVTLLDASSNVLGSWLAQYGISDASHTVFVEPTVEYIEFEP